MKLRKLSEWTRFVGVGPVEVQYELLGVSKFGGEDPRGFLISAFIADPADQVQELTGPMPLVNLGVENFGDLVLRFTIDFDGQRRRLNTSRDGVRSSGFQLRDVENWMDGTHGVQ